MSRRKKKDQKRERLQRAAKKREQLEARRTARYQKRQERRLAGTSWHDDLFKGSPAHRGQAWCILGFVISMVLMALIVLPAQLLAGGLGGVVLHYVFLPIFLPSFIGLFVFRYFEYVLEGEHFGRGQPLDETLSVPASSYQTKEIKEHTDDLLKIGPTLRDRMFGLVFLLLPSFWYGLLVAFWFLVPSAYEFDEDASLLKISMPFVLPLPFVIVGIAFLALPRTLTFDRAGNRLRISNWWTKRVLLLNQITSLQLIPGQAVQRTSNDRRRVARTTSYSTTQLNLVLDNPDYPRLNIAHDADRYEMGQMAMTLASFLNVPLEDPTGFAKRDSTASSPSGKQGAAPDPADEVEGTLDDLPQSVRDDLLKRVPSFKPVRVVLRGDSIRMKGRADNREIQIKLELEGTGADRRVRQFQFQHETRSSFRSLKGKQLIDERKVRRIVLQQARQAAESYGAPFQEISCVKQGTVQGRRAFDIKASSGDWRVEVELLDDGEVLEVELQYRPR